MNIILFHQTDSMQTQDYLWDSVTPYYARENFSIEYHNFIVLKVDQNMSSI